MFKIYICIVYIQSIIFKEIFGLFHITFCIWYHVWITWYSQTKQTCVTSSLTIAFLPLVRTSISIMWNKCAFQTLSLWRNVIFKWRIINCQVWERIHIHLMCKPFYDPTIRLENKSRASQLFFKNARDRTNSPAPISCYKYCYDLPKGSLALVSFISYKLAGKLNDKSHNDLKLLLNENNNKQTILERHCLKLMVKIHKCCLLRGVSPGVKRMYAVKTHGELK